MSLVFWSWLLIVLAVFDWMATVMLIRASWRLHEPALEERATASTILTVSASAIAVLAGAYLAKFDLPDGFGTALLIAALVGLSVPQIVWAVAYRVGRFR